VFELGHARLRAEPGALSLAAVAPTRDGLRRVEQVIGSHLERFGRRDDSASHARAQSRRQEENDHGDHDHLHGQHGPRDRNPRLASGKAAPSPSTTRLPGNGPPGLGKAQASVAWASGTDSLVSCPNIELLEDPRQRVAPAGDFAVRGLECSMCHPDGPGRGAH